MCSRRIWALYFSPYSASSGANGSVALPRSFRATSSGRKFASTGTSRFPKDEDAAQEVADKLQIPSDLKLLRGTNTEQVETGPGILGVGVAETEEAKKVALTRDDEAGHLQQTQALEGKRHYHLYAVYD
jgi:hypothetical protein